MQAGAATCVHAMTSARLGDVLAELARHGGARLALGGLDLADVEAWARRLGLDVDARELLERTAGNPFLLGQSLSTLAVSGGSSEALPVAAMDLLRQRIMRLTAEAQSLLHLAALAGREVDVDLLIAASGAGEDQVLEALDSAVAQGVLTGSASELRFTHDLMLETIRETLRPVQRARLHSQILTALERSPVPDIFALADHASGAAALDPAAATRWAVAAADLSERRLAYDEAVKWWRRALELSVRVRTKVHPSRAEMLLRLTAALLGAGNAVEALSARALLLEEVDPETEPELEARALTAIDPPSIWLVQQYDEIPHALIARLESALDRNPARDATRSRLLASLANALGYTQDARRSSLAEEAVEIATYLDDPYALGYALNAAYFALDADFGEWREVPVIAQRLFELTIVTICPPMPFSVISCCCPRRSPTTRLTRLMPTPSRRGASRSVSGFRWPRSRSGSGRPAAPGCTETSRQRTRCWTISPRPRFRGGRSSP